MKSLIKPILMVLFVAGLLISCQKEGKDVKPGLYVEQQTIKTFPTDTVRVKGTASNYVGISSVTLECKAWEIGQVYDLSSQTPVVFNYDYQMIVPSDASFDNVSIDVTVKDINGLETVKVITIEELADFVPPTASPAMLEQISVPYDPTTNTGSLTLAFSLYDRRGLKSIKVEAPEIGFSDSKTLSGMNDTYSTTINFTASGNYEVTATVTDLAGNNLVMTTEAVVMIEVVSDPIQEWPNLFLFIAGEDPAEYIDGFYKYMDADTSTPYAYQTTFYAPAADTKIYLVPTKSIDADMIGVDPNVSTKLLNKNGYVDPIPVPGQGYYGIWVDIQNGTYSFWEVDPTSSATLCEEDIWISGTGFSTFADWGATAEAMTRDGYRYTQNLGVNAGSLSYYFYTSGWARVFRADADSYWWYEGAEGGCASPTSDYTGPVEVTFDSVLPYAVIKKINE